MRRRILITGASGLVGRTLVHALVSRGYEVNALTRRKQVSEQQNVKFYEWNVAENQIDESCVDGIEGIIHLAGENIAALPWSKRRKKVILESRTKSITMLYDLVEKRNAKGAKDGFSVISASATGYYNDRGNEWMTEDQPPAKDYLGQTCLAWEQAVAKGRNLGLRTVSLRSGMVLAADGGVYQKISGWIKKGVGIVPGKGTQWMPWIHIDDVVAMYIYALEHDGLHGVYNMAAPEQVNFSDFVRTIAQQHDKALWFPHIPAFLLRTVLGQMSELLLNSTRVSVEKIQNAGFAFTYPTLKDASKALV